MSTVKIDNKDYDLDKMSVEAKEQLANLQYTDQEINRLKAKLAMAQTARNAYAKALENALLSYGFSADSAN